MTGTPSKVITDGSEMYSIGGSEYFKNGTSQSSDTNDGFTELDDMKVLNQNIYMIKKRVEPTTNSYRVYINGIQIQEMLNVNNNSSLNSIFMVAN